MTNRNLHNIRPSTVHMHYTAKPTLFTCTKNTNTLLDLRHWSTGAVDIMCQPYIYIASLTPINITPQVNKNFSKQLNL